MNKQTQQIVRFIKRNSSAILTGLNIAGSVVTTALTIDSTIKACDILKDSELSKKEKFKQSWKYYIPPAIALATTIGCSVGAQVRNKQIQSMLMSAYMMSEKRFKDYRETVVEEVGEEKAEDIYLKYATKRSEIPPQVTERDDILFVDEFSGTAFWSSMQDVLLAESELNRTWNITGEVSYNTWRRYLNLPEIEELGEDFGWDKWRSEVEYDCYYIDFYHKKYSNDDGQEYTLITMPFGPYPLWEDWEYKGFWKDSLYSDTPSDDEPGQLPLA